MTIDAKRNTFGSIDTRQRRVRLIGRIGLLLLLSLAACDFNASDAVPSVAAAEREWPAAEPAELDARHLSARGIPDDFLFAPDVVWLQTDRTDIPWQATRVEDPDDIRSF